MESDAMDTIWKDAITACEQKGQLVAIARFSHPHDQHLFTVCILLPKPEGPACQHEPEQYVTWTYNAQTGGFAHGHYITGATQLDALADFKGRMR